MKRAATIFLQLVITLLAIGILTWLLWVPHADGANANAPFFRVYLDPFIAYVYLGSIPFFVAVYQGIRLLGYVGRNEIFSEPAVRSLRIIKFCTLATIVLVAASALFMIGGEREDRPAGVFLRLLITFPSIIVLAAAAILERTLQNAVDIKSENDLTI